MADKITYEVWWCDHCGMEVVQRPVYPRHKLFACRTIHEAIDWITKNIQFPLKASRYEFKGSSYCAAIYVATNDKINSEKYLHARGRTTTWPPPLQAKTAQ